MGPKMHPIGWKRQREHRQANERSYPICPAQISYHFPAIQHDCPTSTAQSLHGSEDTTIETTAGYEKLTVGIERKYETRKQEKKGCKFENDTLGTPKTISTQQDISDLKIQHHE